MAPKIGVPLLPVTARKKPWRLAFSSTLAGHRPLDALFHGLMKSILRAARLSLCAATYGAKYPNRSSTRCVGLSGKTLTDPLLDGTIARFEVTAPSTALSVATVGCGCPCGHMVMKPSGPGGTTVALKTYAFAAAGTSQPLPVTSTFLVVVKGGVPAGTRESSTRHGDNI
jgi:hypothetical protein